MARDSDPEFRLTGFSFSMWSAGPQTDGLCRHGTIDSYDDSYDDRANPPATTQ